MVRPTNPTHLVSVLGLGSKLQVSGTRDEKVAQIATRQRGRVSRRQLLAAGLGREVITGLVRRGSLVRRHDGVYAVGHAAPVALGNETAALLASPDGSVLSHLSAAMLWGLIGAGADDGVIHILIGHNTKRRRAGIRFHRSRRIDPSDLRIHRGLPVVSPARAILEIAEMVSTRMLERAIDEAEVQGLVRPGELERMAARFQGRVGAACVRAILDQRSGTTVTRSEAEERFLRLIRQAELPVPELNATLDKYEVDFLWREAKLVVEIDGFRFHGTRQAFERDRRRDAKLAAAGYRVLRFTWRELIDHPYAVVARLAQTLIRAAAA